MYVLFLQQRIIYPFGLQGVFAGIPQGLSPIVPIVLL